MSCRGHARRKAIACGRNRHVGPSFSARRLIHSLAIFLSWASATLGHGVVSMWVADHSRPTLLRRCPSAIDITPHGVRAAWQAPPLVESLERALCAQRAVLVRGPHGPYLANFAILLSKAALHCLALALSAAEYASQVLCCRASASPLGWWASGQTAPREVGWSFAESASHGTCERCLRAYPFA